MPAHVHHPMQPAAQREAAVREAGASDAAALTEQDCVDGSPPLLAQRQRIEAAFGAAVPWAAGAPVQRVGRKMDGVDAVQGSARAKKNMRAIHKALNDAAATAEGTLLPNVKALQDQLSQPDKPPTVAVPPELAMLFGDKHKLAGLAHIRQAAELLLARRNQNLYLSTYADRKGYKDCYRYLHNHDGAEIPQLGSTNLNAGSTKPINFSATVADASDNVQFTTILHEHAHAVGYKIDDLGYEHELALARLEKAAPQLAPHNADSVAHGALALSGLAKGADEVRASHAARHGKIVNEAPEKSLRAHILYSLKIAWPFELRTAWRKADVKDMLPKMQTRYGATGPDWVDLAGKLSVALQAKDLLKESDAKEVMYNLTLKTQKTYKEVADARSSDEIDKEHTAMYTWMSGLLTRGIAEDPKPAPKPEPKAAVSDAGWGKRTIFLGGGKSTAKPAAGKFEVNNESVKAVRDIVNDSGARGEGERVSGEFRDGGPYDTREALLETLRESLGKHADLAEEIVEYLAQPGEDD